MTWVRAPTRGRFGPFLGLDVGTCPACHAPGGIVPGSPEISAPPGRDFRARAEAWRASWSARMDHRRATLTRHGRVVSRALVWPSWHRACRPGFWGIFGSRMSLSGYRITALPTRQAMLVRISVLHEAVARVPSTVRILMACGDGGDGGWSQCKDRIACMPAVSIAACYSLLQSNVELEVLQ